MSGWTEASLRRAALEVLDAQGDERAHGALAHADIVLSHAAARWESSAGPVEGHRVTLGVDATTLGALRAAPSIVDALCGALATALAAHPGETLLELRLRWSPSGRSMPAGYRDAPSSEPSFGVALAAYLHAVGRDALANAVTAADVDASAPRLVTFRFPQDALTDVRHDIAAIEAAVRDLLGDSKARVRLRLRNR